MFLPGKFHEQRSLADLSARDWKELNMTKHIHYLLHHVSSNPYFWISLKTVHHFMPSISKILHYYYSTLFHQASRLYPTECLYSSVLLPCTRSPYFIHFFFILPLKMKWKSIKSPASLNVLLLKVSLLMSSETTFWDKPFTGWWGRSIHYLPHWHTFQAYTSAGTLCNTCPGKATDNSTDLT